MCKEVKVSLVLRSQNKLLTLLTSDLDLSFNDLPRGEKLIELMQTHCSGTCLRIDYY